MRNGIIAMILLLGGLSVASWLVAVPQVDEEPRSAATNAVMEEHQRPVVAALPSPNGAPTLPDHLVAVAPVSTSLPDAIVAPSSTAPIPPAQAAPTSSLPAVSVPASADASAFLSDLNTLRSGAGLAPLSRRGALDSMAQSWVETMAADGSLRHSELIYDVIAGSWIAAGENIGYGPSESSIFEGLTASPAHLENMVNPDYTSVGIGTVRADGVLWTVHLFAG